MVTIEQLLKQGTRQLKEAGFPTPRLDAEVILYRLLKVERIYLFMYPEKEVEKEIADQFFEGISKRLNHMPIQYIVNHQEFMGLDLWVEPGVLIPRGDTEILVEKVIDLYHRSHDSEKIKVMDIGTGSGSIAVSIAKYIEGAIVTAIDISHKALEIAEKNAIMHGVDSQISFLLGSLFAALQGKNEEGEYHFIVSNPPYIPNAIVRTLDSQVKDYEPLLALEGGEDGLDFYRNIIGEAPSYLKNGGWLIFEVGYDQGPAVKKLMEDQGFGEVEIVKDLASLDRVVFGRKV